jgi:XTP/dITP diphosphohydrolase
LKNIILATRNPGKVKEISAIMKGLPFTITGVTEIPGLSEVVEDGKTLEENAYKKAREIYLKTGIPTLSDDTGLEVYHLNMEPGVFSARYAGEHVTYEQNNTKLLSALERVPFPERQARFRCVAAFVTDTIEKITVGMCHGHIATEPHGTNGFGYDPLFVPDGYRQSFGELSDEIKNSMSHRAKAFLLMKEFLSTHFR